MKTNNQGFIVPLLIVIIAAATIGGGVYYSNKVKKEKKAEVAVSGEVRANENAQENANNNANLGATVTTKGTLQSLIALESSGKNQMCTFTGTSAGTTSGMTNGTIYLNNGSMRADVTTTTEGKTTDSHLIKVNNDIYAWSGTTGGKFSWTSFKTMMTNNTKASSSTTASTTTDYNQTVDYKCEDWNPESAKFVVPTNIKFTDMTKLQAELMGKIKLGN